MKKSYISPEVEVTCFLANEPIAAGAGDGFWNTYGAGGGSGALDNPSSVDVTIPGNPEGDF